MRIGSTKFFLKSFFSLQGAFIQGRDIHDNILETHEILNAFSRNRKKKSLMAIKLNMEKAYDRVQ